jgi:hypothetical protein
LNPAQNKKNSISRLMTCNISKYSLLLYLLIFTGFPSFADNKPEKNTLLQFELYYETLQPQTLKSATLHVSPDKLLGHTDSVKMRISANETFQDTLYLSYPWIFPVHAWVVFEYSDRQLTSNKFYLDPQREKWVVSVSDTAAIVKAKPKYSFEDKNSYMGMVLLIQIALELILASLLVRLFRWPAWVILVVLVSNLATFPIYMLKLQPAYLSDILMLFIKFLVIVLTGRKRLGIPRIIILVITLTLISFGFKQLLIVASKLI